MLRAWKLFQSLQQKNMGQSENSVTFLGLIAEVRSQGTLRSSDEQVNPKNWI